jgi:hypothetical protein
VACVVRWRPAGASPPAWVEHDIGSPAELIHQLAKFFDELNGGEEKLVLDLNFRDGTDPVYAINEIKYLASQFGAARWARHIKALEIGNEVDLYGGTEGYRNHSVWTTALYDASHSVIDLVVVLLADVVTLYTRDQLQRTVESVRQDDRQRCQERRRSPG